MDGSQLHADLLRDAPILPFGVPYGVREFGGDIHTNPLCRLTAAHVVAMQPVPLWTHCLEIGAGGGRWTRWLHHRCKSMICVDRTIASKRHIDALKLTPPIMHLTSPWGSLPTKKGSPLHEKFDLVFSYDTFVHFGKPLIKTYIKAIGPALCPGGYAVIHHASLTNKLDSQPTDTSGNWCPIEDYLIDSLALEQGLQLIHTIRAKEGFGSRVATYRKD